MNSKENENEIINNLSNLREDKGLSIAEVATRLKLSSVTIKKIENSDFDDLGAYIYIRGYINNYAELLGVDAQKYLDLVPKEKMHIPLVNTRVNNAKTIKFKRQSKSFVSYALGTFIVIAISFSGWFLLKNYSGITSANENTEIVDATSLEITPQDFQNELVLTPQNNDESQFHLSSIIPTTEASQMIEKQDTSEDSKVELNEQEIQSVDGDEIPAIEENTLDADDESQLIDQLSYKILISASQTSWVKVEHLDGSKLHNDMLQAGNLKLNSDKPIHFRIGNKDQVSVSINGETIDLSKYSSKNIADFNWPLDS